MKTKIFSILSAFVALSISTIAQAQHHTACSLKETVQARKQILISQYNEISVGILEKDLNAECKLEQTFKKIGSKIDLEKNQLLNAIRFVDRYSYDSAKYNHTPVSKIYQTFTEMKSLPLEKQSDEIWRNFTSGYAQLPSETARFAAGEQMHAGDLKRVHAGFYQYSDEIGDHSHIPYPGQLLYEFSGPEKNSLWWTMKEPANQSMIEELMAMNHGARLWGFIDNTVPVNDIPIFLVRFDDAGGVYRTFVNQQPALVSNWLKFLNSYERYMASGFTTEKPGNYPLMSPLRFALYVQKLFVSIHPFAEGNGRTSRFYQDMVLRAYGFPSGPSGDLSYDDTLSNWEKYYKLGLEKFEALAQQLQTCVDNRSSNYDCESL